QVADAALFPPGLAGRLLRLRDPPHDLSALGPDEVHGEPVRLRARAVAHGHRGARLVGESGGVVMRLQILNDKSGPIAFWLFWAFCVIAATAFWLVVASVASADPYTVSPTGTTPLITYTEPTTYTTGAAITDLKETHIYWKIGTGAESTVVVPASKATGGGVISNSAILIPILPCQSAVINVTVS